MGHTLPYIYPWPFQNELLIYSVVVAWRTKRISLEGICCAISSLPHLRFKKEKRSTDPINFLLIAEKFLSEFHHGLSEMRVTDAVHSYTISYICLFPSIIYGKMISYIICFYVRRTLQIPAVCLNSLMRGS